MAGQEGDHHEALLFEARALSAERQLMRAGPRDAEVSAVPGDSIDAREQREAEQAMAEPEALEWRIHAETCQPGWLGEDESGRPIPCQQRRPTPSAAPVRPGRWRTAPACCEHCDHAVRGPEQWGLSRTEMRWQKRRGSELNAPLPKPRWDSNPRPQAW